MESVSIKCAEVRSDELIVEDGLAADQLRSALHPAAMEHQPANIQEEMEQQSPNWHCEWGSALTCVEEPSWPANLGELPPPPRLLEDAEVQAALTFPNGTGLGWDGTHPKNLTRVSRFLLR